MFTCVAGHVYMYVYCVYVCVLCISVHTLYMYELSLVMAGQRNMELWQPLRCLATAFGKS